MHRVLRNRRLCQRLAARGQPCHPSEATLSFSRSAGSHFLHSPARKQRSKSVKMRWAACYFPLWWGDFAKIRDMREMSCWLPSSSILFADRNLDTGLSSCCIIYTFPHSSEQHIHWLISVKLQRHRNQMEISQTSSHQNEVISSHLRTGKQWVVWAEILKMRVLSFHLQDLVKIQASYSSLSQSSRQKYQCGFYFKIVK